MAVTFAVLLGFILDCAFGDPQNLWHPVCAIGSLISKTERLLRRIFPDTPRALTIAGVLLWGIVCVVSFAVPALILWVCGCIHPALCFAVQTLFCYQIFARRSLAEAGKHVYIALARSLD